MLFDFGKLCDKKFLLAQLPEASYVEKSCIQAGYHSGCLFFILLAFGIFLGYNSSTFPMIGF